MQDPYLIFTLLFDSFFTHVILGIQQKTTFVLITWFITEHAGHLVFLAKSCFSGQSCGHHCFRHVFLSSVLHLILNYI